MSVESMVQLNYRVSLLNVLLESIQENVVSHPLLLYMDLSVPLGRVIFYFMYLGTPIFNIQYTHTHTHTEYMQSHLHNGTFHLLIFTSFRFRFCFGISYIYSFSFQASTCFVYHLHFHFRSVWKYVSFC